MKNPSSHNCLILGCGRSGTSMVAGCIAGTGYSIGGKGHTPNAGNPKGYFETKEVNGINDQLLRQCKGIIYPKGVQAGWLSHKQLSSRIVGNANIQEQMSSVMKIKPFVLKDPRFSYTLSVWRKELPADIKFICMFRHPVAVVASMLSKCNVAYGNRITITKAMCFEIWLSMYKHIIIEHSQRGNWLFLHYSQVMFENGLDSLDQFLNIKTDREFVDKNLLRSTTTSGIPNGLKDIYQHLCGQANFIGDGDV